MKAFFFGCWKEAGHCLYEMKHGQILYGEGFEIPWFTLDSQALVPPLTLNGNASLNHKDGWTALCVVDNTLDKRPGSYATFVFDAVLNFDEALSAARQNFPHVVKRIEKITSIKWVVSSPD